MLLNVEDHRVQARRRLPRFVFDYLDGGADDEACLRRNRSELEKICLQPRCLRDVSQIDTSVSLFGQTWKLPLAVAPTGFNGLLRPGGDLALARAAASAGIPFALSTASNERIETIGQAAPGIKWFQLYVMGEREGAEQMLARAREAGFSALVLTVDVPTSGNREKDVRNGFRLPFRPTAGTLLNLCRHPRWLARLAFHGMPSFVNLAASGGDTASAQAALLARAMDRSLVWDSLKWLRSHWDGPILLKGLLSPHDARLAIRHGADGIIVSNHGGRQLDAAPATIAVLPAIADAVADRVPVLVDSGFRRGSDIAKALALGARAVLIGRPLLYGLACGGQAGAGAVLDILAAELQRSMTLIGAASIGEIALQHVWQPAQHAHPVHPSQAADPAAPAQQGVCHV
jgi:(S)-mandelate dehydrogenase